MKKKVTKGYIFKPAIKMQKMAETLENEGFPDSWTELAKKAGVT